MPVRRVAQHLPHRELTATFDAHENQHTTEARGVGDASRLCSIQKGNTRMKIGYVRTAGENAVPMQQITELVAGGCSAVFVEASGGSHLQRPVLHRMIEGLHPGDEVLVVDMSRLSREASQMEIVLRRIQDRGAKVVLNPEGLQEG